MLTPPRGVKLIKCTSKKESKALINEVMNNGLMKGIKSNRRAFLYFSLRENIKNMLHFTSYQRYD